MTTLTLVPDKVVAQDLGFYDGEYFTLTIVPNSVPGQFVLTIDENQGGRSKTSAEAIYQLVATDNQIDLSSDDLTDLLENRAYFHNVWSYFDGRWFLCATGKITRRNAIRPTIAPPDGFTTYDAGLADTDFTGADIFVGGTATSDFSDMDTYDFQEAA